jgi:hypothetical protein
MKSSLQCSRHPIASEVGGPTQKGPGHPCRGSNGDFATFGLIQGRPPKFAFYATDVVGARATLLRRGLAEAGPVRSTANFDMCDCEEPDGNAFQYPVGAETSLSPGSYP